MGQELHSTDEIFRVVLKDQETPPPGDAWYNIQKALDAKKRVRFIWTIRALAATFVLLVTFASGYFIANYKNHSIISANKQSIQTPGISIQTQPAGNQIIQSSSSVKKETAATSDINIKETKQASSNSIVIAAKEKSPGPPISNISPFREDSRLAYIVPIQSALSVRGINRPGVSALEFRPDLIGHLSGDEIVLDNKNSTEESKGSSRWSLGGQISPLYAFRETSTPSVNTAAVNQYSAYPGPKESGIISYSGGMNVEYKASKRLSVSSGLYYSRMGQNIEGFETTSYSKYDFTSTATKSFENNAGYSFQNSTGKLNNTSPTSVNLYGANLQSNTLLNNTQTATLLQTMDFLEVPVMLRYKIIDRKVGFHLLGGLSTQVLMANKLVLEGTSGKQDYGRTDGLSTFNYSSTLGLGVDYAISTRIHLNLEPAFKYYINSVNSSGNIDSHPYSFGIYSGMRYTF